MSKDPIVNEVRSARERNAAKHDFDVKAILSAAKKRQSRSGHRVVSRVVKKAPEVEWVMPPASNSNQPRP